MASTPIYLDNNATTRTDPRVVESMLPYYTEHYGNAASRHHAFGWKAEQAVQTAREQIAGIIGANPKEIIFTSGATESNNLALKGVAAMYRQQGRHIITAKTEHRAVLDPCRQLEHDGFHVTFLPVDEYGRVSAVQVGNAITDETILVSIMTANNEVGTINPTVEIGKICKEKEVLFHTDAVQAVGKIPVDVERFGADLLSLTAHKLHGPKGIGALYVRRRNPHVRLQPMMDGGGHERGMRSGTLPVANIVGFGEACRLAQISMPEESQGLLELQNRLFSGIQKRVEGIQLNGHPATRLPNNLNISFAGVKGDALMMSMKRIAVSSGSACTSANVEPSYVLRAMGVADDLAHASIRFGVGRFNTPEEVDIAVDEVVRSVIHLRSLNPLNEFNTAPEKFPIME